jgi:RNA polymerase sigma-70 factor (ECF subfamily)
MGNEAPTSGPEVTDDGLVARMRTDRAAFAALYDRYYPWIVKYCVRRLFDRATAEDVTSEVFLKVASSVRTFPGATESDFRRWLFRIAINAVNAHLRSTLRRQELLEQATRRGCIGRDGPADAAAAESEKLDWPNVYRAVMELEEREQTIVSLRFFADLSHEEISDVVQSTPGAVRTALSRALSRLRERFGTRGRAARVSGEASQG